MKTVFKKVLGVTLLEVLLVLVIASLVLVMSIRYYQNATNSAKANSAFDLVGSVISAADSYINAGNAASTITSATVLAGYFSGGTVPTSPFGANQAITITGASNGSYTIGIPEVTAGACGPLVTNSKANTRITSTTPTNAGQCTSTGTVSIVVSPSA